LENNLTHVLENGTRKWQIDVALTILEKCTEKGCHFFIPALVNDPDVTLSASMTVSGHNNYSAHMTHDKTNKNPDTSIMNAVAPMPYH
jgi:hypothetical protein